MGLLRDRDHAPDGRRFQMHEKLVSIGDDAWIDWIDDGQGDRVFKMRHRSGPGWIVSPMEEAGP